MVAQTQFDPQNANALFSPDQWLNQFSNYNNAALPWPSSYVGTPTDAMGNPIKPPPGLTLNSSPAAPPQAPAAPQVPQFLQTAGGTISGGSTARNMGVSDGNVPGGYVVNPAYAQQQQQAAAAPQAAPQSAAPSPALNSWQNTMAMLANPGKVTTPGATVPATTSTQPGPGSLQAFLQSFKPAQSGPGSGFQKGFGNTLKGMGY